MSKTSEEQSHILNGVRVVDLGHYISAPITSMMLAEQGAEVIHIANPGEKSPDPILDAILARSKKQIELDLNVEDNRKQLIDLLAEADIVIENYTPGTFSKFGINFDEIREKINPQLISCSIPAFPIGDPRRKTLGFESIGGMGGMVYERPLKTPKYFSFPIGSVMAAMYAANAVVAALIARKRDGYGQNIETSIFESAQFTQILTLLVMNGAPRSFMPLKMVATPFMGVWKCSDERYIYVHITMARHNEKMLNILEKIGFDEDLKELRSVISPSTMEDPSLVKDTDEASNIKRLLAKIYSSKPAEEWEKLLGNEFCCIKIRTLDEWIHDSMDSGMQDCIEIEDPIMGKVFTPGPSVVSSDSKPILVPRTISDKPIDGIIKSWKDSDRVSVSDKTSDDSVEESKVNHAPLEGIKVLDLARIIAGPFAARVLRELGAEVISIQSPKSVDWALSFHVVFNTGKKSVTLNLSDEADKKKLWDLIDKFEPNLVVQNYRNLDITKSIGIDYESFKEKIPNIAYTYLNAYGITGGWQHRPAFEQIVQAVTGIQMEYVQGGRPKIVPMAILDMGAGLMGAFSSLLGLYSQQINNKSTFVSTHMTSVAMLFQITNFSTFQRNKCLTYAESKGIDLNWNEDEEIKSVLLKSESRTFIVSGRKKNLRKWFRSAQLVRRSSDTFESDLKQVRRNAKKRNYVHWKRTVERGYSGTIGIMRRYHTNRLFQYTKMYNSNLPLSVAAKKDYPGLATLTFLRTPMRFSKTSIIDVDAAPIRGMHTEEVLSKYGIEVPEDKGIMPYPKEKPILIWLWNFLRWGLYALTAGTI